MPLRRNWGVPVGGQALKKKVLLYEHDPTLRPEEGVPIGFGSEKKQKRLSLVKRHRQPKGENMGGMSTGLVKASTGRQYRHTGKG